MNFVIIYISVCVMRNYFCIVTADEQHTTLGLRINILFKVMPKCLDPILLDLSE